MLIVMFHACVITYRVLPLPHPSVHQLFPQTRGHSGIQGPIGATDDFPCRNCVQPQPLQKERSGGRRLLHSWRNV